VRTRLFQNISGTAVTHRKNYWVFIYRGRKYRNSEP